MNGLILTTSGAAEIEAAYQNGQTVTVRHVLLGDGGGQALPSTPDEMAAMTSLYGEFGQEPFSDGAVEEGFISGDIVIDCKSYPGKTLRELGMISDRGTLIAYGRYPDTFLPDQTDSVIKEVILTLVLGLTHAQSVVLEVDPDRAIITQETGDRRYLQRKNNLSDVEYKDEAVENLGLKPTVDKAKNAVQRDGDTMTGKLILPQTSAFGVNTENMLGGNSLAIGEGQTGLKQVSGTLSIFVQGNEVFYLEEDTITAMVDILLNGYLSADKVMVASSSGGWIDMRNQSVFLGRNPVSTNSAQALLRQDHADRKYFLGGLGNKQFGIYMINNSRSDNGTDGQAYMDESGNWLCGRQIIPSDYGNFDARYAKTGASITSVRLGSRQSYSPAGNWYTWTQDLGSGNVMTGIIVQDTGDNSADNIGGIYYRTIQYCVNGTWMNVSSI
ncbi:phage tail protein [Escherichia coli]|uniref:phage tail-collar fiber domain-containing protein n=3 Tax=Escherichia coli TaxID=562 RepID=UPI0011CE9E49|nr:phage tail protein [Escherichia coli]EEW8434354.1 phage tail protein [Escherichia coli]EFF8446424.1 phage tail protein [Escherichia coli]EFT2992471.1 phage tail protein [Escherichia coli]EGO6590960.1 phage tail protein [Escherichia coli]EHJ5855419.1 phage tail protein [Escherichia coli]